MCSLDDETDPRGVERAAAEVLQREGVLSLDEFRRRFAVKPIQQLRMRPLPAGARMMKLPEPSASEGLWKLLRILTQGARFMGQYLPSWLPTWDSEDGRAEFLEGSARQRFARPGTPACEITVCAWHPDQNYLALAVWKQWQSNDGQATIKKRIIPLFSPLLSFLAHQ